MNYYNENDPFAAQWLRNLIEAQLIPAGHVDARSIKEVNANDIRGFTQCHFFAGIGGWSLALALAAWPASVPVWTGSCPCQPFSAAGKRKGTADERHLWPEFRRLIAECRPPVCFGEQVASKDGREWLAGVRADLEGMEYAVGAADLCAASQGTPGIRQRLWWVADAASCGYGPGATATTQEREARRQFQRSPRSFAAGELSGGPEGPCTPRDGLGNTDGARQRPRRGSQRRERGEAVQPVLAAGGAARGLGHASDQRLPLSEQRELSGSQRRHDEGRAVEQSGGSLITADACRMGYADCGGSGQTDDQKQDGIAAANAWSDFRIVECSDGSARRVGTGVQPLAYGIPAQLRPLFAWLGGMGLDATPVTRLGRVARTSRVGRLRGYGNAIVPQVAAEFIGAYLEAREEAT